MTIEHIEHVMNRRLLSLLPALCTLVACSAGPIRPTNRPTDTTNTITTSQAGTGQPTTAQQPRSSLAVHIQNVHAGGSLPHDADPRTDALDVSFELVLAHNGTEPLSGITVPRVRLVHDDGRAIVFGVFAEGWDGRLEPRTTRVVEFRKTPDSATPRPDRQYCGQPMRVEVTVELAGRTATATSRRVRIECPTPVQTGTSRE